MEVKWDASQLVNAINQLNWALTAQLLCHIFLAIADSTEKWVVSAGHASSMLHNILRVLHLLEQATGGVLHALFQEP